MADVFVTLDPFGREVRLTQERWTHITRRHPDLAGKLELVRQAIEHPTHVVTQRFDIQKQNYYLRLKEQRRYLLVVARYINADGVILTAFITRSAKTR